MLSLWLVPAAFMAHVAEEAPGFTSDRRVFAAYYTALIVAEQVYRVDWCSLRR